MEITQLIELVYWMLIVFCALFGVAFIIALVVIIKGWGTFKKEVFLDGEEILKSPYKYGKPDHTITHYSTQRSKQ